MALAPAELWHLTFDPSNLYKVRRTRKKFYSQNAVQVNCPRTMETIMIEPQDHRQSEPSSLSTNEPPHPKAPDLRFHPLADLFPLPGEDELRALADDIADHGLREPIVTLEGQILDGRCRYLACKMAAVDSLFESDVGDDPIAYVLSRNFHRRHLTQPQRAMVAARLANLKLGANQHSQGLPIGRACQLLNVSERSVARAKEIVRSGTTELIQAVESGEVSLHSAAQICRMPLERQQGTPKYDRPGSSPALPDSGSGPVSQSSVDTAPRDPNGRPTLKDEAGAATSTKRFPGWIWPDVIPQSGVTVIVGGAATVPVAIKVAAIVYRGEDWPDYSRAPRGGVFWMSAVNGFVEQLHPQIAPPVPSFNVHLIPPQRDEFGLPIRHFARDLDRLRRRIKETTGVVLVTLDSFSDYVCCDDVERAIKDLHPAIEALNQFAIENEVAVVLPSKLAIRARTAASRAANAFKIIPEIATVIVAGESKLVAVKLPTGQGFREFGYRIRRSNSMPTIVWDGRADETMGDSLFDFEPPATSTSMTPASVDARHQHAGGDDHASAIRRTTPAPTTPDPPTLSELSARTAGGVDASGTKKTEAATEVPLGAKPKAATAVDGGIKYGDLQVPGFIVRPAGRVVFVRRKSRRSKKVRDPSEDSPFRLTGRAWCCWQRG